MWILVILKTICSSICSRASISSACGTESARYNQFPKTFYISLGPKTVVAMMANARMALKRTWKKRKCMRWVTPSNQSCVESPCWETSLLFNVICWSSKERRWPSLSLQEAGCWPRLFNLVGYLYSHVYWNDWFGNIPLRGVPGAIFIEVGEARTKKHVRTEQFKFKWG